MPEWIIAHLPETDAVRVATVPALQSGLAEWRAAVTAEDAAAAQKALADGALATAEREWERLIERTWAALIELEGAEAARRYFPRNRRGTKSPGDEPKV